MTTERVEMLANGRGAFGAYWELARTADGRLMVWRECIGRPGTRADVFDSEADARAFFAAYTTGVGEEDLYDARLR